MKNDNSAAALETPPTERWITSNPAYLIGLIGFTALGLVLRLYHADVRPLWLDEIHTFQVINEPASIIQMLRLWWKSSIVSDPPLYYIFNYLISGGDRTASFMRLRILGIIMGTACIPLISLLTVRMIGSRFAGLIAAFLMAINTFAIQFSQEYRPYSQLLFFSIIYLIFQVNIMKKFSWTTWIWLLLSALCLIYTHYFGLFFLTASFISWGLLAVIKKSWRPMWLGYILLPAILCLMFAPMLAYGLNQTKMFSSGVGKPDNQLAAAMLKMFLDQKKYINFWTDIIPSLSTYYLGKQIWLTYFVYFTSAAGLIYLIWRRRITGLFIVSTSILFLVLNYSFYEIMKYPYEPRRSISAVALLVVLQAAGLYYPLRFGLRSQRKTLRLVSIVLIAGFTSIIGYHAWIQLYRFDTGGHRNQTNQADWPAMADFIKANATPDEQIAVFMKPGNTWWSSHFQFYHKRRDLKNEIIIVNSINDLSAAQQNAKGKGIWYVLGFPPPIDPGLLQYLLEKGEWKSYYGGALVYLNSPQNPDVGGVFVPDTGFYALAENSSDSETNVKLVSPLKADLLLNGKSDYALLPLIKGFQRVALSAGENASSVILHRKVLVGQWNSAINVDEWEIKDPFLDFVADDENALALSLQYNGIVRYRFYLDEAGDYTLSFKAKNDAPGPIAIRVWASGSGELENFDFSKGDNSFSVASHPVKLNKGLNELRVYYPSFRRIKDFKGEPLDSFTQFIFSSWRLDHKKPQDDR